MADETFYRADEVGLKQPPARIPPFKQRGTIMWDYEISVIYDRSCEKYLADVVRGRLLLGREAASFERVAGRGPKTKGK
jgi:hypothetical protein